ncbi:MAG: hypothetical protein M1819_003035 [Sarea resinae]|nr:MAG: hypothetical protein M1819_003035 [Sarea resinae]
MSSHQYQRVSASDADDNPDTPREKPSDHRIPTSPPPSFRSRTSSPTSRHLLSEHDPLASDADRTLADTFGTPSDDEGSDSEDENGDDRQRLMRGSPGTSRNREEGTGNTIDDEPRPGVERRVTELPVFAPSATTTSARRVVGRGANDGVFANLDAKPERGEKTEEQPPTYEQAAADATPPYWETTILAPGMVSDEVYVDGLPVGSVFSFIWNGMISMSFQLVGFLLTYLLHTTHAAKNGSRAGLGITLVQYGFYMKGSGNTGGGPNGDSTGGDQSYSQPPDPNSHDFDPSAVAGSASAAAAAAMEAGSSGGGGGAGAAKSGLSAIASSEWLAYILMVIGWFILIRAVSDFFKARRHEQLVLQSPDRGLGVAVVAEGEAAETVV